MISSVRSLRDAAAMFVALLFAAVATVIGLVAMSFAMIARALIAHLNR